MRPITEYELGYLFICAGFVNFLWQFFTERNYRDATLATYFQGGTLLLVYMTEHFF